MDRENRELLQFFAVYMRQIFSSHFQAEDFFEREKDVVTACMALFRKKFGDGKAYTKEELAPDIEAINKQILRMDDDYNKTVCKILLEIVQATVRTNWGIEDRVALCIKMKHQHSHPQVTPLQGLIEVFMVGNGFAGVHLRTSLVARGGIRISDRSDFRRELIQLVYAQDLKNVSIVPTGAKGCVYRDPSYGHGEEQEREVVECYEDFITTLLSITDNIDAHGAHISPKGHVCYDGEDPYLVVAADKGTATFSDTANALSQKKGFWLKDAFASGGTQGYNHKGLGITSQGVWVSVRHHFQRLGLPRTDHPITVVGVGDMSGDVFGNGMLQEKNLQLLGAFDHRDIFVDPCPNVEQSYAERQRLFALERSSWQDYNRRVLSKGGAIFSRSAPLLKLTSEIRKCFGIEKESVTPDELIRTLLSAKVDLLWMGGVGIFVKSEYENHETTADCANDTIRITSHDVRAHVVGEGANLGFTQKARVSYALSGGAINTDTLDNFAGVNCSDHEVNLKILLEKCRQQGMMDEGEKYRMLRANEHVVVQKLMAENAMQNLIVSYFSIPSEKTLNEALHFIDYLIEENAMNAPQEALELRENLRKRKNFPCATTVTRPEMAVLLSCGKSLWKRHFPYEALYESTLGLYFLQLYFPENLSERFSYCLKDHPLAAQIIASTAINRCVNLLGPFFIISQIGANGGCPKRMIEHAVVLYEAMRLESFVRQMTQCTCHFEDIMGFFAALQNAARIMLCYAMPLTRHISTIDGLSLFYQEFIRRGNGTLLDQKVFEKLPESVLKGLEDFYKACEQFCIPASSNKNASV